MRGEERRALQATADALRRETQVIRGDASLLRQQLANRLLHAPGDRAVLSGIAERGTAGIAWLRLCNARRESDLLLAVTSCGQEGVFSAAVDDGRKLVYTGGADGSLVCWDARMVTEIARIRAHESVVRAIGIDAASRRGHHARPGRLRPRVDHGEPHSAAARQVRHTRGAAAGRVSSERPPPPGAADGRRQDAERRSRGQECSVRRHLRRRSHRPPELVGARDTQGRSPPADRVRRLFRASLGPGDR